jgi:hypothetical protein
LNDPGAPPANVQFHDVIDVPETAVEPSVNVTVPQLTTKLKFAAAGIRIVFVVHTPHVAGGGFVFGASAQSWAV